MLGLKSRPTRNMSARVKLEIHIPDSGSQIEQGQLFNFIAKKMDTLHGRIGQYVLKVQIK